MTSFQAVFTRVNAITGNIEFDTLDPQTSSKVIQEECLGNRCPLYLDPVSGVQNENHLDGAACSGPSASELSLGIATISITDKLLVNLAKLVEQHARCKPELK